MDSENLSTILVVDDIDANRQTLADLLHANEYRVLEAADGFEALQIATATPPDLVLLDVMMPEMDGYEVCRRLRADERLAEVPVVMITALDDQDSRLMGLEAGADDFITKPFHRHELRARIRTICRLNRFRRLVRAGERIREQASLLDGARDAIVVRDLNGRIVYWNKGAEGLFGWSAEEALARSIDELFPRDSRPVQIAWEAVARYGEWTGELELARPDGSRFTIETRWTQVREGGGSPRGVMLISSDVTEQRQLEKRVLRMQRIQSIGALAGGIAHDLNNVLAPILMSVELLRLAYPDKSDHEILATIESSANRGTGLVRQLLAFVRGSQDEKMTLPVAPLIHEMATIISETFPKSISARVVLPKKPWAILGDVTQLHQILLNLCVNARDAMPGGGILSIIAANVQIDPASSALYPEARPGPYVMISVADTGQGIPSEIRERIFEPFFTTKPGDKSTGLGLATVRDIVTKHEGFMRFESEVGRGTEFKVFLPAVPSESPPEKTEGGKRSLPAGQGELILVADDETAVLGMARATLEAFGYQVLTARDGAQAVALCARNKDISLMLVDTMMPIVDGPSAIQAVRRIAPHIKIIAETGLDPDEDSSKAPPPDAEAFLQKPYTAERLLDTIHRVLRSGPTRPVGSST